MFTTFQTLEANNIRHCWHGTLQMKHYKACRFFLITRTIPRADTFQLFILLISMNIYRIYFTVLALELASSCLAPHTCPTVVSHCPHSNDWHILVRVFAHQLFLFLLLATLSGKSATPVLPSAYIVNTRHAASSAYTKAQCLPFAYHPKSQWNGSSHFYTQGHEFYTVCTFCWEL